MSSGQFQQQDYTSNYLDTSTSGSYIQNTYIARQANTSRFDNPNIGSIFLQSDDCPIASIFDIDCTNPYTNPSRKLYQEEEYGSNSKCFNSVFEHPTHGDISRGVCLQSFCNYVDRTLEVYIGGEKIVCNDDEKHQFPLSNSVYFTCPPLLSICPEMACPSMCSGNGFCNYDLVPPQCECYDDDDTSPGCYGVGVEYYDIFNYGYEFEYPEKPYEVNIGDDDSSSSSNVQWSGFSFVHLIGVAVAIFMIS